MNSEMKQSIGGIARGAVGGLMRLCLGPEKTIRQTVDTFYESSDYRRGAPWTRAWKRYVLEAFCKMEWKVGSTFADLPIGSLTFWHVDAVVGGEARQTRSISGP
jgi:hypothetical protein